MDFDIGNILYIVITLIALALGLFGKKKKKPGADSPGESGSGSQPGFLENLERALNDLGREETAVVQLKEDEPDLVAEEESYESYEPFKEYLAEKEQAAFERYGPAQEYPVQEPEQAMEPVYAGEETGDGQIQVVDLDKEKGVNYFDVVRNFDLGTAVVYSAIINRLDY